MKPTANEQDATPAPQGIWSWLRPQFGLRWLLAFTALVAVVCALIVPPLRNAAFIDRITTRVAEAQGEIGFFPAQWTATPYEQESVWTVAGRKLFGDRYFGTICGLSYRKQIGDQDLDVLSELPEVYAISLLFQSNLTRAQLLPLSRQDKLRFLSLTHSTIDANAAELVGELPALEELCMADLKGHDMVLQSLAKNPANRVVDLIIYADLLSDGDVAALTKLPRLRKLSLFLGSLASDSKVGPLSELKVEELNIWLDVNWPDIADFHCPQTVTYLNLRGDTISDPQWVLDFVGDAPLKYLGLGRTNLSEADVNVIQAALPDCAVYWSGP